MRLDVVVMYCFKKANIGVKYIEKQQEVDAEEESTGTITEFLWASGLTIDDRRDFEMVDAEIYLISLQSLLLSKKNSRTLWM